MNKLPLLAALCLAAPPAVGQDKPKMSVSAGVSMEDLLRTALKTGTRVVITLRNGTTSYSGWVKDVSAGAVVIKDAQGKEFYELYVVLSDVAVVEVRVK